MLLHIFAGDAVRDALKGEGREKPIEDRRRGAGMDGPVQARVLDFGVDLVEKGCRPRDRTDGSN